MDVFFPIERYGKIFSGEMWSRDTAAQNLSKGPSWLHRELYGPQLMTSRSTATPGILRNHMDRTGQHWEVSKTLADGALSCHWAQTSIKYIPGTGKFAQYYYKVVYKNKTEPQLLHVRWRVRILLIPTSQVCSGQNAMCTNGCWLVRKKWFLTH